MTLTPFRYDMDEAILAEIRTAILHSSVPLKDLARAAGMSPDAVSGTVIGRTALSVGELGAIAGALGTTGAELMKRAEQSLAGPCPRQPGPGAAMTRQPGAPQGSAP